MSRNVLKGNKNYLELAGVFLHYSKCETEIQGKSTLVRVSARFELARVRVGSFENEALENEDRSMKHPKLENEAPKT